MTLKHDELHAPVGDWRAVDTHLQAYEERRAREAVWREGIHHVDRRVPVVPAVDTHRAAARGLLRDAVRDYQPLGSDACEQAHRAYQERRASAQMQVRLADRLSEEVPAEIRRLAETPSAQEAVDAILAQRAKTRTNALREANHEPAGRNDGSRVDLFSYADDAFGWELAGQQARASVPQVAQHTEMAAGPVADLRLRRRRRWFG
jgi:hypothetical protein